MADYKKESLSLIVTVLNEAKTLLAFLKTVEAQKYLPNELVIVDGGSNDESFEVLKKFKTKKFRTVFLREKSNRSLGRNLAVNKSSGQLLAITDAGCLLEPDWLENLIKERRVSGARVVAGFYQGLAKTNFERAVIPYFLVMPDQLDKSSFLPATRSMLIERSLWDDLGGLDEDFNYSEDYQLAKKIKNKGIKIGVTKEAIVNWLPPKNWRLFFKTVFLMAKSDVLAGVMRSKVYLVFARYLLFLFLAIINFSLFIVLFLIYLIWALLKNYRYVKEAAYYLPLLQIVADLAVMSGTISAKRV